ncbi:hypothetical protein V8C86DRAFT_3132813 [Haematococcus lacustris]
MHLRPSTVNAPVSPSRFCNFCGASSLGCHRPPGWHAMLQRPLAKLGCRPLTCGRAARVALVARSSSKEGTAVRDSLDSLSSLLGSIDEGCHAPPQAPEAEAVAPVVPVVPDIPVAWQRFGIFALDAPVAAPKVPATLSFIVYYWNIVIFLAINYMDVLEGPGAGGDFLEELVNDHLKVAQGGELARLLTAPFVHHSPWALFIVLVALSTLGAELEAAVGYAAFAAVAVLGVTAAGLGDVLLDDLPVTQGAVPAIAALVGGLLAHELRNANLSIEADKARKAGLPTPPPPSRSSSNIGQGQAVREGGGTPSASGAPSPSSSPSPPPPTASTSLPPALAPAPSHQPLFSDSASASHSNPGTAAGGSQPAAAAQVASGPEERGQGRGGGSGGEGGEGEGAGEGGEGEGAGEGGEGEGVQEEPLVEAEVTFFEGLYTLHLPASVGARTAVALASAAAACIEALNDLQAQEGTTTSWAGIAAGLLAGFLFTLLVGPRWRVQRQRLSRAVTATRLPRSDLADLIQEALAGRQGGQAATARHAALRDRWAALKATNVPGSSSSSGGGEGRGAGGGGGLLAAAPLLEPGVVDPDVLVVRDGVPPHYKAAGLALGVGLLLAIVEGLHPV